MIRSLSPLTLMVLSLFGMTIASAQNIFRPMEGARSGRFIEAPRSVQQHLRDAQRALDEKSYSEAVVGLGELLTRATGDSDDSDLAGQDFFTDIEQASADQPSTKSVLREARAMIAALPPRALETYELRYGPIARKLLTEAAQSRDWDRVREVRQKYFHTKAGCEASVLLAQQELFLGRPLAASLLLDPVVEFDRAHQYLGAGLRQLHRTTLRLAGRSDQGETPESVVGEIPDYQAPALRDYAMFGGSPGRNGSSSGQMPLTNLRWMLNTTASPRQERTLRKVADELATSGKLPPPSWMPLRVGNQLLMRTTERLVGVDYRTGKRVWTYPWQSSHEVPDEEISFDELPGDDGPSDLLSQRVWNDVPYGQVTSDGQRVFMLDDLGEVEMVSLSPMMNLRGTRPADTSSNTLVALEIATEGKLLWRLGSGGDEASTLANAFFLGPPLPLDGRLYVMVEIAGDVNLCCLDPATGKELWRQHLVAVESGSIDSDPIRRVAGAMPTYHEGLLICPTGAGAMVAINLADRMLQWGVQYDRNSNFALSVSNNRGRGIEASQLMQRWDSGVAVASGRTILVTPIESDRLFGFDLITAKPLFAEKNRVHLRYLAGLRNKRFYVAGAAEIRAFDQETGNHLWTTPRDMLSAGQQIAGRGVFGDKEYLIPTTTNQLVSISLADGKVLQRRNTRYPLGNLVAVEGEVIIQGPTTLAVAFGEATLEPIVTRMLEADPNDFEATVRKSELLIQRGQRDEALKLLARARRMQPDNDEVHMLSVSAMLGTLREDLDAEGELIEMLSELIDRPTQRIEFLSLRVRAALKKDKPVEAAEHLIALSSLLVNEPVLESISDQVVGDSSRQCRLDSWVAGRVNEIVTLCDNDELAEMNQQLAESMAPRLEGSTGLLERLVKHFGNLNGVEGVRSELIQRFITDQDFMRLERLMLGSKYPTAASLADAPTDTVLHLAKCYADGGLAEDAVGLLEMLEKRELSDADLARSSEIRAESVPKIGSHDWPEKVSLKWDSRQTRIRFSSPSQRVAKTKVIAGKKFSGWRLMSEGTMPLALRDPTGLPRVIPMEGLAQREEIDKEAVVCGGAMVVLMPGGLACIDLYHLLQSDGEAVLWQRGLTGDGSPVATRRSVPTPFGDQLVRYYIASTSAAGVIPEFKLGPVMGDRLLLLQGGDLMAIDLITKETLWRNSDAPKSGMIVSNGKRVAVVSSATRELVTFNIADGKKMETTPWQHGEAWEAIGSHVLCYDETDTKGEFEIRLVDPLTDEVILRTTSLSANRSTTQTPSAYGRITDGRYLAMLQSDGQALVWDLMEGREIARPKLAAYPDLQGLHVVLLDEQLLFLAKRRVDRPRLPQAEQLQTADGASHQTTHAVFAVSLTDGTVRWQKEFDKPWGCTLSQPAETPILLLTRSPFTYSIQSRKKFMDVMALDVRDGNVVTSKEGHEIQASNNNLETRLTVQEGLSRVIAQIGPELLTFNFER